MSTETTFVRPLDRRADPPIFLPMALLFLATAVAGFAPSGMSIAAGTRQVPLVVHLHGAAMLTWLLLLVVQAALVNSRRVALHRTLGTASYVVAAAVFGMMVAVTWTRYGDLTQAGYGPLASNILLLQLRSIELFPVFYLWAIATRRTDSATHKRAMLVATLVLLDAAIARMTWLPGTNSADTYDGVHLWLLALFLPALAADLVHHGRVHRVYVVGLVLLAPWLVATHFLWNDARWHSLAAALLGS
jgi:hypothetical protein